METTVVFGQCETCGKDYAIAVPKVEVWNFFCPHCGKETSNLETWDSLGEPDAMTVTPDTIRAALK